VGIAAEETAGEDEATPTTVLPETELETSADSAITEPGILDADVEEAMSDPYAGSLPMSPAWRWRSASLWALYVWPEDDSAKRDTKPDVAPVAELLLFSSPGPGCSRTVGIDGVSQT
jgi:hypothetical protein